jgi:hypothetical protein
LHEKFDLLLHSGNFDLAPADDDERAVRFVFVSCQNTNQGAQNAYRRMIFEDAHTSEQDRIGFILHLGDFIYELVWYPEDRPQGMYDRRLRDIVRYQLAKRSRIFIFLRSLTIIVPSIARIFMIACRHNA